MTIRNEYQYRYVLKMLDEQIAIIKELRCDHMSDIARELPEISNLAVFTRAVKLRDAITGAFKANDCKFPFVV